MESLRACYDYDEHVDEPYLWFYLLHEFDLTNGRKEVTDAWQKFDEFIETKVGWLAIRGITVEPSYTVPWFYVMHDAGHQQWGSKLVEFPSMEERNQFVQLLKDNGWERW